MVTTLLDHSIRPWGQSPDVRVAVLPRAIRRNVQPHAAYLIGAHPVQSSGMVGELSSIASSSLSIICFIIVLLLVLGLLGS